MNENSKAIIVLCSYLCADSEVRPLEPAEWSALAVLLKKKSLQPEDVLKMGSLDLQEKFHLNENEALRILRLSERSVSIGFEVERLQTKGISIMTRADRYFPGVLKKKLGKSCPPLLYYVGNPSILENRFIGMVGSRSVSETDMAFTEKIVETSCSKGFSIVSGGANGVDTAAVSSALLHGAMCVEYLSDSLLRKIRNKKVIDAIRDDSLLLMSVAKPDAGFSVGMAMARNKYIYSQSEGTVVVKSDFNKGGTWSGAVENIKQNRCQTFVWNNADYKGNIELVKKGAIPIDEKWNGELHFNNVQNMQLENLTLEDCSA